MNISLEIILFLPGKVCLESKSIDSSLPMIAMYQRESIAATRREGSGEDCNLADYNLESNSLFLWSKAFVTKSICDPAYSQLKSINQFSIQTDFQFIFSSLSACAESDLWLWDRRAAPASLRIVIWHHNKVCSSNNSNRFFRFLSKACDWFIVQLTG